MGLGNCLEMVWLGKWFGNGWGWEMFVYAMFFLFEVMYLGFNSIFVPPEKKTYLKENMFFNQKFVSTKIHIHILYILCIIYLLYILYNV